MMNTILWLVALLGAPLAAGETHFDLHNVTAETPTPTIVGALEALRAAGTDERTAALVTQMLRQNASIYNGRAPYEVDRLRAWMFLTLAEVGIPDEAVALIAGELAHGHRPISVAAAARAAAVAPRSDVIRDALRMVLRPGFHDEQVSLTEFYPSWPLRDPTTAQHEAMLALEIVDTKPSCHTDIEDAAITVPLPEDTELGFVTPFLPVSQRAGPITGRMRGTDHRGRDVNPATLRGKPAAMTFFYTRCESSRKCGVTMSRFAALQDAVMDAGLDADVRLVAVTYDPAYDTAQRLGRFAISRRIKVGDDVTLLRPDIDTLSSLVDELGLSVSWTGNRPATHAVELALLDREGRLVRAYRNVVWEDAAVVSDLRRLVAEH